MRCEDFPCCGHEIGCCPPRDSAGRQTGMVCTCGKILPLNNRYSICDSCLNYQEDDPYYDRDEEPDYDEVEDMDFISEE